MSYRSSLIKAQETGLPEGQTAFLASIRFLSPARTECSEAFLSIKPRSQRQEYSLSLQTSQAEVQSHAESGSHSRSRP
jgi:hypothetical protein